MPKPNTILDILWRLIQDENGCLNWSASKFRGGYGKVRWQGKLCKVHRVLWEYFRGPIPEGMQIHHRCRTTACANPEHLAVLTPAEHVLENDSPPGQNARKTHCKRGHPLSGDNVAIDCHGLRQCRICMRLRDRAHYYRDLEKSRKQNREAAQARYKPKRPKAFCAHGHHRIPENLYPCGSCRICVLARSKDRYERLKGKQAEKSNDERKT